MASPRCIDVAVDILNKHFGEDFDTLSSVEKIYDEYSSKEKALLLSVHASEKQTSDDMQTVMQSCEKVLQEIQDNACKIDEIIKQFSDHTETNEKMETEVANLNNQVKHFENEQIYLSWKKSMEKLSSNVEVQLQQKNIQSAISILLQMNSIHSKLSETSCGKLKTYLTNLFKENYNKVVDLLSLELDASLASMNFPFPTGITSARFTKKDETEENFKRNISLLCQLHPINTLTNISLIPHLLSKPMMKRFHFHFYGKKSTNNIEKPEWYFTQVINWIRDHTSFFQDYIQPMLGDNKVKDLDIKDKICYKLVKLCEEKLMLSYPLIMENEALLGHYIDETLLFEKALKDTIGDNMQSDIGCLHILLQEEYLQQWLDLEKKFASESMTEMLTKEDAWISTFSELDAPEKLIVYFIPQCVEKFLTLLSLMTERHKTLNKPEAQLKFLEVVITSLHEFMDKIKDLASMEVICPESQHYCSILNGVFYIHHVLTEWTDDLYFLQLFEWKESPEENVFQNVLDATNSFTDQLVDSITEYFEEGLKPKVKAYKTESWHGLPSLKDYIVPVLTPCACDLILFVKEHLNTFQEKLCSDVFEKVWKNAAKCVDHLLFREVVFECHFNEGGAAQFQYDIKKNLFVIFGQYTNRPEFYFKLLKDSCLLLNLLPGSAVLLKEVLAQSSKTKAADQDKMIESSLTEIGIKYLTISQASRLIQARVDWPKV